MHWLWQCKDRLGPMRGGSVRAGAQFHGVAGTVPRCEVGIEPQHQGVTRDGAGMGGQQRQLKVGCKVLISTGHGTQVQLLHHLRQKHGSIRSQACTSEAVISKDNVEQHKVWTCGIHKIGIGRVTIRVNISIRRKLFCWTCCKTFQAPPNPNGCNQFLASPPTCVLVTRSADPTSRTSAFFKAADFACSWIVGIWNP